MFYCCALFFLNGDRRFSFCLLSKPTEKEKQKQNSMRIKLCNLADSQMQWKRWCSLGNGHGLCVRFSVFASVRSSKREKNRRQRLCEREINEENVFIPFGTRDSGEFQIVPMRLAYDWPTFYVLYAFFMRGTTWWIKSKKAVGRNAFRNIRNFWTDALVCDAFQPRLIQRYVLDWFRNAAMLFGCFALWLLWKCGILWKSNSFPPFKPVEFFQPVETSFPEWRKKIENSGISSKIRFVFGWK